MNVLQQMYPGDEIASFIVRVLAEITLVTLVALGFGRMAARQNAALRHGICVCALACVLVAPFTTLGLQRLGWHTMQISLESEHPNGPAVSSGVAAPVRSSSSRSNTHYWTLERARSTASLMILIWIGGSAVLLFRLGAGMRKVKRLRLSAQPMDHPNLDAAIQYLVQNGGMPNVPIRFSRKLHSPVVVGPRNTMVILPEKLLDQLNDQQLSCVLAHELTHVRQRDPLIGVIQRLVEASYWPHPLVHLLNRDLVRAREEVCDNVALRVTTAPQYAATLLTVALGIAPRHLAASNSVGLMTRAWKLEERVKGLLDPQRRLTTKMNTRHIALMAISLAAGVTLIGGTHIVAAPNPPTLQDTVELHAQFDKKTHSVVVTQKPQKQGAKKADHVVQVKVVKIQDGKVTKSETTEPLFLQLSDDMKVIKVKGNTKFLTVDGHPTGKVMKVQVNPSDKGTTFITTVDGDTKFDKNHLPGRHIELVETRDSDDLKPGEKKEHRITTTVTTDSGHDGPATFTVNGDSFTVKQDSEKPMTVTIDAQKDPKTGVVTLTKKIRVKGEATKESKTVVTTKSDDAVFVTTDDSKGSAMIVKELKSDDLKGVLADGNITFTTVGDSPKNVKVIKYKVAHKADGKPSTETTTTTYVTEDNPKVHEVRVLHDTKPTVVYVNGGDIKIVGDSVKVVYGKSTETKTKSSVKTKTIRVKTKG